MKDDLDLTFGEIFHNDPAALLAQLQDIEVNHKADRQASEDWAKRLRFIDISGVPQLERWTGGHTIRYKDYRRWSKHARGAPCILPIREKEEDDGKEPYIAVSWRWTQGNDPPWGYEIKESSKYQVQRPGHDARDIDFPNHYLERVILFAQSQAIGNIWIDKECIFQRRGDLANHPGDRDLGVQAMDLIYGAAKCCIGLLTTSLIYQEEIILLSEFLSRNIFVDPEDTVNPRFKRNAQVAKVQVLILRLLTDVRWSRGWIFQEDHLASQRMTLLVPYSKHLKKYGFAYDFGQLPRDLIIALVAFRKAVTMFCIASNESEKRWPFSEMLGKAKQYNIWNMVTLREIDSSDDLDSEQSNNCQSEAEGTGRIRQARFPTTTLSILDDVCNRSLEKIGDRVAIIANAAKFERRIDVSPSSELVRSNTYSLSTVLLALILLNGEIFSHRSCLSDSIMEYTLRKYLEAVKNIYDAPVDAYEQSYIDRYRFTAPTFTRHGLEVEGHLYKFLAPGNFSGENGALTTLRPYDVEFEDINSIWEDSGSRKTEEGRTLSLVDERCMSIVVSRIRRSYGKRCWLAGFLQQHINIDRRSHARNPTKPSERYVLHMMVCLVHALSKGRNLSLARLANEPDTSHPAAIFVGPEVTKATTHRMGTNRKNGDAAPPSFVFTSLSQGCKRGRRDCYASLIVDTKTEKDAPNTILESYGWINGVWSVEAHTTQAFTYQIPGLTDWRMAMMMRKKRKREEEEKGRRGRRRR